MILKTMKMKGNMDWINFTAKDLCWIGSKHLAKKT